MKKIKGKFEIMYDIITKRRSVRKFTDKNISEEDIQKIIDAGLSAPSGGGAEPWRITVIQNKDVQRELVQICKREFLEKGSEWRKNWAKMDNFNPFYDPDVLFVIGNKSDVENSNEDCCFLVENMVLMAESLGLSSCIIRDICWAINKENQEKFGLPKEYDCFMCISVGYASFDAKRKKNLDYSKVNFIK